MKKLLFILLLFPFVSVAQDTEIVTAYTKEKDTLYITNNSVGELFYELWEKTDYKEKPVIIRVKASQLKALRTKRNLIVNRMRK